jgi:hypothetical protein
MFCSVAFAISFVIARLVYGSIICVCAFRAAVPFLRLASSANDTYSCFLLIGQAALCLLTRVLNVYWTWLILGKVMGSMRRQSGDEHPSKIKGT